MTGRLCPKGILSPTQKLWCSKFCSIAFNKGEERPKKRFVWSKMRISIWNSNSQSAVELQGITRLQCWISLANFAEHGSKQAITAVGVLHASFFLKHKNMVIILISSFCRGEVLLPQTAKDSMDWPWKIALIMEMDAALGKSHTMCMPLRLSKNTLLRQERSQRGLNSVIARWLRPSEGMAFMRPYTCLYYLDCKPSKFTLWKRGSRLLTWFISALFALIVSDWIDFSIQGLYWKQFKSLLPAMQSSRCLGLSTYHGHQSDDAGMTLPPLWELSGVRDMRLDNVAPLVQAMLGDGSNKSEDAVQAIAFREPVATGKGLQQPPSEIPEGHPLL